MANVCKLGCGLFGGAEMIGPTRVSNRIFSYFSNIWIGYPKKQELGHYISNFFFYFLMEPNHSQIIPQLFLNYKFLILLNWTRTIYPKLKYKEHISEIAADDPKIFFSFVTVHFSKEWRDVLRSPSLIPGTVFSETFLALSTVRPQLCFSLLPYWSPSKRDAHLIDLQAFSLRRLPPSPQPNPSPLSNLLSQPHSLTPTRPLTVDLSWRRHSAPEPHHWGSLWLWPWRRLYWRNPSRVWAHQPPQPPPAPVEPPSGPHLWRGWCCAHSTGRTSTRYWNFSHLPLICKLNYLRHCQWKYVMWRQKIDLHWLGPYQLLIFIVKL